MSKQAERYESPREIAARLSASEVTVRRLIASGDSPDLADAVLIACAPPRVGYAVYRSDEW